MKRNAIEKYANIKVTFTSLAYKCKKCKAQITQLKDKICFLYFNKI
jgi:hypothetical protein